MDTQPITQHENTGEPSEDDPNVIYRRGSFTIRNEEERINDLLSNNVWRKAIRVDGELRWTNEPGTEVGDLVPTDRPWKFRSFGKYMLLAAKDEVEQTVHNPPEEVDPEAVKNDPTLTEDEKFEILLDYIVTQTLKDEPLEEEQPQGEFFRDETRLRLRKERLKMLARQELRRVPQRPEEERDIGGFIAVDIHGNFDLDHDNPGPVLKKETQWITMGYTALSRVDNVGVVRKKVANLGQAFMSNTKTAAGSDADQEGYESSSSEVSQDHCRVSPFYPPCDSHCWLKQIKDTVLTEPELPTTGAPGATAQTPTVYSTLNPGQTRVLVLQPGAGMEPIVCHLAQTSVPDVAYGGVMSKASEKQYEAFSYTWGDPTRTHTITCNDEPFPVTTNLFHALNYLRRRSQERTLWIDALCINQDDTAERNEQVRYMLNIYKAAQRVIVWLGLAGADGGTALTAMNFLNSPKNRQAIMQKDHEALCLIQLNSLINILDIFFQRPWFSRCWIRQEVFAAKTILVQCGAHETNWNAMKRTSNCMWRLREELRSQKLFFAHIKEDDGTSDDESSKPEDKEFPLHSLRRHWILGQSLTTEMGDIRSVWYYHTGDLLELLMVSRLFDATDPRDKVYSILGLAQTPISKISSKDPTTASRPPSIKIDYSATISEVYQYVAKYIINRDRTLDLLCILNTHRDHKSNDLPSWTPDWRVPVTTVPFDENLEYFTYKWGAAGFTKCRLQDQGDHGRLVLEGFPVARILELLPICPTSIPHPPEIPAGDAAAFDPAKHVRRFAITDRKAAVVPASATVGDVIFVLYGCKMPIALRLVEVGQSDITTTVVGPCYVPEVMFGEALRDLREDEAAKRTMRTKIILV